MGVLGLLVAGAGCSDDTTHRLDWIQEQLDAHNRALTDVQLRQGPPGPRGEPGKTGPAGPAGPAGHDAYRFNLVDATSRQVLGEFVGALDAQGIPDGWVYLPTQRVRVCVTRPAALLFASTDCSGTLLGMTPTPYAAPALAVLVADGRVVRPNIGGLVPGVRSALLATADGAPRCAPSTGNAQTFVEVGVRIAPHVDPATLDLEER